ncbi:tRNA (adenosine(37)-N6)-threonylcarbamoyltransferase complex transferase subunit TsaD [Leptospira ellisii]|uniref:tRNA N6-adenosine threonylcarbamoyltransferase n=1 Tax=Leptospira ellisii TaxID=2023197 RepID=A0A2N0BJA9_9LEPT|nr:tRNA (adenosine(37)-N6)-threonylcarbamoyltransferase complex transferase subunit TsaD [Leptospira ellisii]MDV6235630.1 tRNA (adenosine(37)-N6)-threonylcarbamoyltransferase complex transferase subunit TsaD [Leptospira ellisii]PJZ92754.1 tRNA (adenosine(37)-N6)-threonylcarbamoyltransferase complex transferase subunit TsaD [Leptospira ellisii]PKA04115.1 tRNA (adenosine(37)-N6)-threonylcarbamoyltransferase complex transferase subunit TsaD [Leptospira ellisii]
MIGMGIETSCDETSIGIVRDGKEPLSLRIFSQIDLHKPYGGIVPEIASRAHLEKINLLLEEAMDEAKVRFEDLEYVAVTSSPGLTGSLMVGAQLARCIHMVYGTPILPVCHLQSHFAVLHLEGVPARFPALGLLLSGGNSAIYILREFGRMELLGDTMDDALGEAFDKVAGLLGLPYPGGPYIEAKAQEYLPSSDEKPILPPLLRNLPQDQVSFSFSGLKTAVMVLMEKQKERSAEQICWNFQNSAFDLVERNLKRAVAITGIRRIYSAGGVLANSTLQKRLQSWAERNSVELFSPKKKIYCTDNGAMVATLGYYLFRKGYKRDIDFTVSPSRQEIFS